MTEIVAMSALVGIIIVLCGTLIIVSRRARLRARTAALDAFGREVGIEPMLVVGQRLGWIERFDESSDGVRVRVKR